MPTNLNKKHRNQVLVTAVTDAIFAGGNIPILKTTFEGMIAGDYSGPALLDMLSQMVVRQKTEKNRKLLEARQQIAVEVAQVAKASKVLAAVKALCGGQAIPGLSPNCPPLAPLATDSLLAS